MSELAHSPDHLLDLWRPTDQERVSAVAFDINDHRPSELWMSDTQVRRKLSEFAVRIRELQDLFDAEMREAVLRPLIGGPSVRLFESAQSK